MTLPTISRRALFVGMIKSRLTVYNTLRAISICSDLRGSEDTYRIPFLPRGHASHAMKFVQDGLEAGQHGTVQLDRERSLETRLVLGLGQETLQLDELDLQMQLPS